MYFASGDHGNPFPFEYTAAPMRSSDYQSRLSRYANLYLTDAMKQELASLGQPLRFDASEIPMIQASFLGEDAKKAALKLIRSFHILDLAYQSLQLQKNALQYAENNRSTDRSAKVVTGVLHSCLGYNLGQDDVFYSEGVLKFSPAAAKKFPGVTAPISEVGNDEIDMTAGEGARQLCYGHLDAFLAGLMKIIKTPTPDALSELMRKNLSKKTLQRVFAGLTAREEDAAIAAEQQTVMKAMGDSMKFGRNEIAVAQNAPLQDLLPDCLQKVRSGRWTAAAFEYDTLLKEVVGVVRRGYMLLKSLGGGSAGPAVFLTGAEPAGSETAWRIPTKDGEALILKGARPVDASGVYYPDAERVSIPSGVPAPIGGAPGQTVPVRVSVPAGAGQQRDALQKKARKSTKSTKSTASKKTAPAKAPAKSAKKPAKRK